MQKKRLRSLGAGRRLVTASSLFAIAMVSAFACSSPEKHGGSTGGAAGTTATPPASKELDVEVTVSAVHLGGDCPDPAPAAVSPAAAPAPATAAPASPAVAEKRAFAADCAGTGCGAAFCQQTSMQLDLIAAGTGKPTKIEIVKVELLDKEGKLLGELTPRRPTKWNDATSTYDAWDGAIAAAGNLKTSYALSEPAWDKVPGGRWGGNSQGLSVRVTVAIGDMRVTKTAVAVNVMIDPQVVT